MKYLKFINEYKQQADKLYFDNGILDNEDRQIIMSITHGDHLTKLVSDMLFHMKKFMLRNDDDLSNHGIKMLSEFYQNLKNYNNNIFPLEYNIMDYNVDENEKHILNLYSIMEEREELVKYMKKLPSIAIRNLKKVIKEKRKHEYDFKNIKDKFKIIVKGISELPRNEELKYKLYQKIFNSNNNIDDMIKYITNYVNAFNDNSDINKDDVIKDLKYINADIIENNDNILVIRVNDREAIERLGCTTKWCFSLDNNEETWYQYAPYGFVYVIYNFDKDSYDSEFLMTYLPDTDSLFLSSNVGLENIGIDMDDDAYLKYINVNMDLIYNDTEKQLDI